MTEEGLGTAQQIHQQAKQLLNQFPKDKLKKEINQLEQAQSQQDFWEQDPEYRQKILDQHKKVNQSWIQWKRLDDLAQQFQVYLDLLPEDNNLLEEKELDEIYDQLKKQFDYLKTLQLFQDKDAQADAYLIIHAGAGGTESCDWAQMLYRMYYRFAQNQGYQVQLIDLLPAEGGIKSLTMQVQGEYAYGFLLAEKGVHRLVRISPFDTAKRRHTSFASVDCIAAVSQQIQIDIKESDLRIDTFRAQGAGGQHVNTTDSAVRITHLPTKIIVQSQQQRSQHQNRAMAMKLLQARLHDYYKAIQQKEKNINEQQKSDISWSHQIRSYVLHPYNLVKDHRTQWEQTNVNKVLDGDILEFIEAYLLPNDPVVKVSDGVQHVEK